MLLSLPHHISIQQQILPTLFSGCVLIPGTVHIPLFHPHEILPMFPGSPFTCPCPLTVNSRYSRVTASRLKSDDVFRFLSPLVVVILWLGENSVCCERPYKTHLTWPPPTAFLLVHPELLISLIFHTHAPSGMYTSLFLPHFPSIYLSRPPSFHVSLCTLSLFSEPRTFPD